MKNKVLSLLLMGLMIPVMADTTRSHSGVVFTQQGTQFYIGQTHEQQQLLSERDYRLQLYWWEHHNPHIFILADFPIDYYKVILVDHIKVLENEIAQKKSGLKIKSMVYGVVFSGISVGLTALSYIASKNGPITAKGIDSSFGLGAGAFVAAAIASNEFYKAVYYNEYLKNQLDRDKRILARLEKMQTDKQQKNPIAQAIVGVLDALKV